MAGEIADFKDVPLDLSPVSPFARTVYAELRKVPAGQTVTYKELACRAGSPRASRAVARAMATNRIPIVIPCHRVVGSGGGLAGFSGGDGLKTKAQLLFVEGRVPPVQAGDKVGGSLFDPYMFDIAVAVLRGRKGGGHFASLYQEVGHVRLPRQFPDNPFAALVETVCYQQLAGSAAAAIFRKVAVALNNDISPESVLDAGEAGLRLAGLSGSKAAAVLSLAQLAGLDELSSLPYDSIMASLTSVRGIGPWTVQMFALFHLGLPDIFPPGDLGIRKAVSDLVDARDLLPPDRVARIGTRWRPFRSVATWYLWKSLKTRMLGD